MRISRKMKFERLESDRKALVCPLCKDRGFEKGEVIVYMIWDCYAGRINYRYFHFDCWYDEYGGYMPSTKRISEAKRKKFLREV